MPTRMDDLSRFELLYREHYLAVASYARRRVGTAGEDVVAETFTAAWRHRNRLTDIDLPWLLRAARHVIQHEHRSAGRRDRPTNRLGATGTREHDDPFDQVVDDMDSAATVRAAMAALAEPDQEILALVAWEQLTPREIAVVLDCSPGAARVRIHRASRRLATVLSRQPTTTSHEPLRRAP